MTKREQVIEIKKSEPGRSNNSIAKEIGVNRSTVGRDMCRNNSIPQKMPKPKRIQYTMTQYTSAENVARNTAYSEKLATPQPITLPDGSQPDISLSRT